MICSTNKKTYTAGAVIVNQDNELAFLSCAGVGSI